jgi:hypothetical protein
MTSFSFFNTSRQIMHVPITAGETSQSSGTWQPPAVPVPVAITGDIQDITAKDLQRLPEGEYEIGDCRIITGAILNDGDQLRVTEEDGSVSTWSVKTLEKKTRIMQRLGIAPRRVYLLKRCG